PVPSCCATAISFSSFPTRRSSDLCHIQFAFTDVDADLCHPVGTSPCSYSLWPQRTGLGYHSSFREKKDQGVIYVAESVLSGWMQDRKSTRLNSSHVSISYAVFCLK